MANDWKPEEVRAVYEAMSLRGGKLGPYDFRFLHWLKRSPAELAKMARQVRRFPPQRCMEPRTVDGVYIDDFGISFRQLATELYAGYAWSA